MLVMDNNDENTGALTHFPALDYWFTVGDRNSDPESQATPAGLPVKIEEPDRNLLFGGFDARPLLQPSTPLLYSSNSSDTASSDSVMLANANDNWFGWTKENDDDDDQFRLTTLSDVEDCSFPMSKLEISPTRTMAFQQQPQQIQFQQPQFQHPQQQQQQQQQQQLSLIRI